MHEYSSPQERFFPDPGGNAEAEDEDPVVNADPTQRRAQGPSPRARVQEIPADYHPADEEPAQEVRQRHPEIRTRHGVVEKTTEEPALTEDCKRVDDDVRQHHER